MSEFAERIGQNPMKVMMMQVFIGNLIKDLKAGKTDEVIAGLEKALAGLDKSDSAQQRREPG